MSVHLAFFKSSSGSADKNDCGKVGVNGGYFQNPNLRFGVNCYGTKPKTQINNEKIKGYFPDYISEEEQRLQTKINMYRNNLDEVVILPFNRERWDKKTTFTEAIKNIFD